MTSKKQKGIETCPICKKKPPESEKNNKNSPFCSKRCKMVDLGKWLVEDYRIIK